MGDSRAPGRESDPSVGLDEVERAMSLLDGRHPEHERTRRELLTQARTVKITREVRAGRRQRRRLLIAAIAGINVVAVGFAVWVSLEVKRRGEAIRNFLSPLAQPFESAGFRPVAASDPTHELLLTGEVEAGSCVVAVAAKETRIHLVHGPGASDAVGSGGFCTCAPESFTISTQATAASSGWFEVLRADARTLGGPLALSYWAARPKTAVEGGIECADETFDAWLHGAKGGVADEPAPSGALSDLKREGFALVASARAPHAFAIADIPAGHCAIAMPSGSARGPLELRREGGGERVASKTGLPIIACTDQPARVTLFGESVILAAPQKHVGGLLGATELAFRGAWADTPTWLPNANLGADAQSILLASGASNVSVGEAHSSSRLIAFSVLEATNLLPPTGEDSFHFCSPTLDKHPRQGLCVQSADQEWKLAGDGALAFAPTPFWLSLFAEHTDPDLVRAELHALEFARGLSSRGFEPTLHDGLSDVAHGSPGEGESSVATVAGREGDDGVVVLGIARRAPWLFLYRAKGDPEASKGASGKAGRAFPTLWDDGNHTAATVVPLKAGETVSVTAKLDESIPKDERRIVVFRKRAP